MKNIWDQKAPKAVILLLFLLDIVIINFSSFLALWIRFDMSFGRINRIYLERAYADSYGHNSTVLRDISALCQSVAICQCQRTDQYHLCRILIYDTADPRNAYYEPSNAAELLSNEFCDHDVSGSGFAVLLSYIAHCSHSFGGQPSKTGRQGYDRGGW